MSKRLMEKGSRFQSRAAKRNIKLTALLVGLSLVSLAWLLARPPVSRAATLVVTSTADSGPGTLRAAIASAAPGDTITFSLPPNSTITLTSDQFLIDKNLTFNGPGANLLTVKRSTAPGTPAFRIFQSSSSAINMSISGLTIANGINSFGGGGIANLGTLTLVNSTVSGNPGGGGILNLGTLTVINSTVSGNTTSSAQGGGILSIEGTFTINSSTISGNSANTGGGGIAVVGGTVTITNSTISGNSANSGGGGGIQNNGGAVTITNSTISGNSVSSGGGGGGRPRGGGGGGHTEYRHRHG